VAKEFVKGFNLKSGLAQGSHLRPYAVNGVNGRIPQTKINYTEIGVYCARNKDFAK